MKKLLGLVAMAPMALAACGGGSDAINVYTRDTTSGTREGFFAAIDADDAKRANDYLVSGVSETTGNGDMISKVKADTQGIGYISLTSLDGSGVKGLDFNGVAATEDNVKAGTYGMSRNFAYTAIDTAVTDANVLPLVEEFNRFLNSSDGEAALISAGVIVDEIATSDYIPTNAVCDGTATDIEIGGSTSVEKAAEALSSALAGKCSAFKPKHNHTGSGDSENVNDGSMHIGFSSSGTRDGWTSTTADNIGKDAIVAVVHNSNSIDNLTTTQLQEIFVKHDAKHGDADVAANTKNVSNWADLA